MVVAGPGNLAWLAGVGFFAWSVGPKRELVAAVCAGLIPHAAFTALFAYLLSKARPAWPRATRIVAGSYLTSGLGGMIGVVLSVFAVGLVAAACGGCRR